MGFAQFFESALQDFLRRYHGGAGYKTARAEFQDTLKRDDVKRSVERVKKTWKDVDENYVRICRKYPHLDIASKIEWDRRLTDEYKRKYRNVRAFIDKRRAEMGINR